MTTAELSKLLFSPVTLLLYTSSMLAYLYAMAFSAVAVDGGERTSKGRRARFVATSLAWLGVLAHVAHIVVRAIASDRLPLGNMFEFSSIIALTVVVGGLVVVQGRMKRPELMGFVLIGALLTLGISLLLYSNPAPLQPILDTWWRAIHVSTIALSAGIFSLAAVFNALHLMRDTAEVRVAARAGDSFGPGTVGAAQAPPTETDEDTDATVAAMATRVEPDVLDLDEDPAAHEAAYRSALRDSLAQRYLGLRYPWHIAGGAALAGGIFSLLFFQYDNGSATFDAAAATAYNAQVGLSMTLGLFLLVGVAWAALPFLPGASTLDSLTYRTIAFAFPIWTFAVITGAMWAEQSWGRFWGWDPKETSAFLTWVAYAGYLHARATRGMNGRKASWLGLVSYGVLLFTYYAVNLVISGLHSYGGISQTVGA